MPISFLLILQVYVRRHAHEKEETEFSLQVKDTRSDLPTAGNGIPTVRKSKLLIVDLAGSERLDKSGMLVINYVLD